MLNVSTLFITKKLLRIFGHKKTENREISESFNSLINRELDVVCLAEI